MISKHYIKGYEEFCNFFKDFSAGDQNVYLYFTGSKLPNGESWCGDCVRAWPVVEKELEKIPDKCHFIIVEVGDRPTWKDPKCPFRTDSKTRLLQIPTLLKWRSPQKLEGEQCEKESLLSLMFGEDDD